MMSELAALTAEHEAHEVRCIVALGTRQWGAPGGVVLSGGRAGAGRRSTTLEMRTASRGPAVVA